MELLDEGLRRLQLVALGVDGLIEKDVQRIVQTLQVRKFEDEVRRAVQGAEDLVFRGRAGTVPRLDLEQRVTVEGVQSQATATQQ